MGTASVVVVDAKFEVVVLIVLPVVVMLHSSLKSTSVPGTVQLNLATMHMTEKGQLCASILLL